MLAKKHLLGPTLFLFLTVPVLADSVTVGCSGAAGGPFDYTSISDALTALHAISFRDHDVTISGTCSEYVHIFDFENLRLLGTAGAILLDPGTDPQPTLNIDRSEHIQIETLIIRGADQSVDLVRIFTHSDVQFRDSVIERGDGFGMFINGLSHVRVFGTAIQDNGGGVRVALGSTFELGEPGGDATPALVQRNQGVGISVDSDSIVGIYTDTAIQDNGGPGLRLFESTANFCCSTGERKILRNLIGINANQSNVRFNGPTRIEENQAWGILLNHGSSARLFGQSVRNNGLEGIFVLRTSEVDLNSSEISDNAAGGLVLRENSAARVQGNTITDNGAEGIHISYLSTMSLFGGNTISQNRGFDVFCAPDSHALGTKSGVGKMSCPRFNQTPDPEPGGPPKP